MRGLFARMFGSRPATAGSPAPSASERLAAPDANLQAGNAALAAGDFAGAATHYRAAIAASPDDSNAHLNLGYALLAQGQAPAARDALWQAVALGAGADAHYLMGQAHAALGDWREARASHARAVDARADFGFAWRDLGLACEHLGEPARALEAYEQAVRHAPELPDAASGHARMLLQAGRAEEALRAAENWERLAPADWAAPFTAGQSLQSQARDIEALAAFDRALQRAPGQHFALHMRANSLFRLQRFAEAAEGFAQAAQAAPDWAEPLANHSATLERLHRYDEALASADAALQRDPNHRTALYNRSLLLLGAQREDEALATLRHARAAHPEHPRVEWDYALGHLLAGRMREAWPAFEARWRAAELGLTPRSFREPLWTGQPLAGKTLLLYPEQGYGDVIQFIRFVAPLEAAGARVLLWMPEPLARLIATVSPRCVVDTRLEALPPFDYHCPIMSLPLGLGTTLETLPATVPYLAADPELRQAWAARLGPRRGLRVGVAWVGNPAHTNDHNRSIRLADFAPIAVPGCEFVSLVNAVPQRDQAALRAWPELRDFGSGINTFADTAALLLEMDLVVSVCTSTVHLAGALGLPVWTLLAYRNDWRWMLRREDSPWYPTVRLFRQDGSCDWTPVIARAREELARRVAAQAR